MNPVFLDTVGLIAVWDTADQWHAAADPVFLQPVASGRALVTTTLVLFECGNAAARRPYRTSVDDLRVWLAARGWLVEPAASDVDTAWADYRAGHTTSAGIVDRVSFAVMRRLGLTEVFTNDRHFQAPGSPSCSNPAIEQEKMAWRPTRLKAASHPVMVSSAPAKIFLIGSPALRTSYTCGETEGQPGNASRPHG